MDNNRRVVELQLDDVLPNRFQPRIKFNEDSINELANSIKEHGVIQPIVVRPVGDRYEIIAGERRYKASTLAGLKTIPAIITDLNDKDSAEVALIENVQRQDLTPIEEAISYKKILDMGYLTQDNLASKLGKTQSTVANKLRLLNLDEEVQEALLNEKISERHARSLLKLTNYQDQVALLNRIINERLTVRKTDEEINKMLNNGETEGSNGGTVKTIEFDQPIIIPAEEEQPNIDSTSFFNIPSTPIIEEPVAPQNLNNQFMDIPEENLENADQQLTPGKFFNILDETSDAPNFSQTSTNEVSEDTMKIDLDFSNIGNPSVQEKNDEFTSLSNFGIPDLDDSIFNVSSPQEETIGNNTFVTGDIKTAINTIRTCSDTIEKYGFNVETEELDLGDTYQVIFKIFKK